MSSLLFCVATPTGSDHYAVSVDMPHELTDLERFLRAFGYLPEGNKGKLKTFWEATMSRLKQEHGVTDATCVLRGIA